jgi:hypothetical protein
MAWRSLAFLLLAGCTPKARCPTRAEVASPERASVYGLANIQRTLRLLATSSASQPHRVRILFYGQSITESAWSSEVASRLRTKYPHAQLEIQNRALGGFSSERLLETAESDLYPWQPDLLIFHVYGAHDKYQALIQRIRARTSAEVLLQTDHITRDEELEEPLAASANPPDAEHWAGFMNHVFLPSLVARHQVALCDLRASWKAYLREQRLPASSLLADEVHLNALGDARMARLVESCLDRQPALRSPAEDWMATSPPVARLSFRGHRVDLTHSAGAGLTRIRIDGVAPSTLDLASFARAQVRGGGKWPPLHGIAHHRPLVPELFRIALQREGARYRFSVRGTFSGDDGEGTTDAAFVSRSERIVIDPTDWDIPYAFELMGRPAPEAFEVELNVEPNAIDAVAAEAREQTLTVASGLTPGPHLLELEGDAPLRGITVYRAAAVAAGGEGPSTAPPSRCAD